MIIVHYEVYVLESRGWMLHARFPRPERDNALAEAKELEQSLKARVRVTRETYYTDDNTFEESEIYLSPGAPSEKPKPQQPAHRPIAPPPARPAPPKPAAEHHHPHETAPHGKPQSAPTPIRRRTPPPPAPRRTRSAKAQADAEHARRVLTRLMSITALALAAAMLCIKITPEAIVLLWRMGFNLTITPESYNQLLVAVFGATFLVVAVPLALNFLPRRRPVGRLRGQAALDAKAATAAAAHDLAVRKSLDKLAAQALAEEQGRAVPKPADNDEDAEELPPLQPAPEEELPEIRPDPEDMAKPATTKDTQAKDAPAKDTTGKEERPDKRKAAAVTAESLQPAVLKFLDGAIAQARTLVPSMDAFTKFALHLYLAGAVETLCDFRKLGDSAKAQLVERALESLGTRGDLARKFYDKLEEYLLEPRYLGVVQAGRDAMGDFMMGDEAGAHRPLRDAILEWTRKSDKKAQIVTVMFTDMVGSTDMTQARGDAAAQEVVRRHNSIVRGALAQFGGKEIKHTGDGIMASFATAAAAAEASISIQRQVNQHNTRLPGQSLHLRIGLNAGEPIEEEDDLFGATVQLAARVCAATNADQTLCTGVVKDLTVGKGAATFRPMGEKYLKGFRDAVPLYEVMWRS